MAAKCHNQRRDLEIEYGIPYLYNTWTQARKSYINLENHHQHPHKPYIARIQNHWPTSLSLIVWVYLHSNFCGRLRNTHVFFETQCVMALVGHPRSLILAPIESAYATSYWSSIVTFVLSCPVSELLQVSWEERPHPYSSRILELFPFD